MGENDGFQLSHWIQVRFVGVRGYVSTSPLKMMVNLELIIIDDGDDDLFEKAEVGGPFREIFIMDKISRTMVRVVEIIFEFYCDYLPSVWLVIAWVATWPA